MKRHSWIPWDVVSSASNTPGTDLQTTVKAWSKC
jgi:hypothetical protein